MPRWGDVEAGAPELAALARGLFDAHVNKTFATLRRYGSPRISGIEVDFTDGDLWFGSMWQALKARDLQRDPRTGRATPRSPDERWRSAIPGSRRPTAPAPRPGRSTSSGRTSRRWWSCA